MCLFLNPQDIFRNTLSTVQNTLHSGRNTFELGLLSGHHKIEALFHLWERPKLRRILINKFSLGLFFSTLLISGVAMANDCLVTNWQISGAVRDRLPADLRTNFTQKDNRVFAFIKLSCNTPVNYVSFCFKRDDIQYSCVKQPVRSSIHWRTWASVKALTGNWSVEVSVDERKLLSDKFVVGR